MERLNTSKSVINDLARLSSDMENLVCLLRQAYPRVRPAVEFESSLQTRLMGEARRLKASSGRERRLSFFRRAAVGVAAVSVAGGGLALVLLRNRLGGIAVQGRPLAASSN